MPAEPIEDVLKETLMPGETVLWVGAPQQGMILRRSDILFIPVSLCFGVLTVGWESFSLFYLLSLLNIGETPAWMTPVLTVLALIGIPLVVLAGFLTVGRFYYDRKRRQNTQYVLSDQRIIIVSGLFKKRNIRCFQLDKLKYITLSLQKESVGSIHFSKDHWLWWLMLGPVWWFPLWSDVENYQPPVFERIKAAGEVYRLVQQAREDYLKASR